MKFGDAFKGAVLGITTATTIVSGSLASKEAILNGMNAVEAVSVGIGVVIDEMDDDAISGLQEAEDLKESEENANEKKPQYGDKPSSNETTDGKKGFDVDAVRNVMRTEPGQAYFWTGSTSFSRPEDMSEAEYREYARNFGGAERAAEIARERGGMTLEMKMDAHKQELIKAGFPYDPEKGEFKWDSSDPENTRAWRDISQAFAQGAQGDVHVVYGDDANRIAYDRDENPTGEYKSIWEGKEEEALKNNEKVNSITAIDPMTEESEEIYRRSSEKEKTGGTDQKAKNQENQAGSENKQTERGLGKSEDQDNDRQDDNDTNKEDQERDKEENFSEENEDRNQPDESESSDESGDSEDSSGYEQRDQEDNQDQQNDTDNEQEHSDFSDVDNENESQEDNEEESDSAEKTEKSDLLHKFIL